MGAGELDLIHTVRENPGITQAGISKQLGTDKGAVARQPLNLEEKGYLHRKPNPADGRSRLIFPTEKAQQLTQRMVDIWNEKMPEYKIGHSTYEGISGGFKKGIFCYITTAVCRSMHKPDDCYELAALRAYRDGYLSETEEGRHIVEEYYNIAPTIVKRIDREDGADEIYQGIWDEYLSPCIRLIEEDKKEECKELYVTMVRSLEKKYLYS